MIIESGIRNSTFRGEAYIKPHHLDPEHSVVPNDWEFECVTGGTLLVSRPDPQFPRRGNQTESWRKAGIRLVGDPPGVEIATGEGQPTWWLLRWRNVALESGRYRITIPIFPDLVKAYQQDDQPVYADDPLAGELRVYLESDGPQHGITEWADGTTIPFGVTSEIIIDFDSTDNPINLTIEGRARWGLKRNGWLISGLRLEKVDPAPPPAPATPPLPTSPATPPTPAAPPPFVPDEATRPPAARVKRFLILIAETDDLDFAPEDIMQVLTDSLTDASLFQIVPVGRANDSP